MLKKAVPEESEQFDAVDSAVLVPIDPEEGGIGLEIPDFCQFLPLPLDTPLPAADGQEQLFELLLQFVAKDAH